MRTSDEIWEQIDKSNPYGASRWAGMTYEQGVDAALRWVLEEDEAEPPISDDDEA